MRYNQTTNTIEKANVFRDDLGFISKEQLFDLLVMVRLLELNRYTESEHHRISKKVLNILKSPSLGFRVALGCIGAEMSKIIREDFTKSQEDDTIEDSDQLNTERKNTNAPTTRIFTSPNTGY